MSKRKKTDIKNFPAVIYRTPLTKNNASVLPVKQICRQRHAACLRQIGFHPVSAAAHGFQTI